ncbi:MAG TPA: c-type cytochrome, partial [Anaerolineae bacterium]
RTPEQWYNIVTNGRLDKLMPPFAGSLNVDQRWDVIVYGWTLSVPPAWIAQGKQVYAAQCVQCHGEKGKGDGPDSKGNLPDFTSFSTIVSVASGKWDQALSTSHLPSFAGTVSVADQRAVIDYVRSFAYDYPSQSAPAATQSAASTGSVTTTTSLTGTPPVPGTIVGYIVNGTAGASTPGNLPITFYVFPGGTGNTVVTQTLQSDAQGRFIVNNVQASHGDLVAAGTTYKDLQFHSELVPYAAQISITVPITVYESTTDASKVQIDTLHVVVVPDANGLQVSEIYVLSNSGDRWVAGFGQPIMRLGLPAGAQNFSIDPNSVLPDTLVQNGDGLDYYDAVPVGSGTAQIVYQYSLPGGSAVLDRPLFQNVGVVNMLIEGDPAQVSVSSPQLTSAGLQSIQGKTYQQYKGANLAPGQTLSINVGSASAAAGADLNWLAVAGIASVVVRVAGIILVVVGVVG